MKRCFRVTSRIAAWPFVFGNVEPAPMPSIELGLMDAETFEAWTEMMARAQKRNRLTIDFDVETVELTDKEAWGATLGLTLDEMRSSEPATKDRVDALLAAMER